MAEGLLMHRVAQLGLSDRFHIESAGTAAYHQGESPDRRSLAVLRKHGISLHSVARQVRDDDFGKFDWILAMDSTNLRDLRRICPGHHLERLHLCLAPVGGGDVPDPYYGGPNGFDVNFAMLDEALGVWLAQWQSA
jgi:protein-tyrosine phosphatase